MPPCNAMLLIGAEAVASSPIEGLEVGSRRLFKTGPLGPVRVSLNSCTRAEGTWEPQSAHALASPAPQGVHLTSVPSQANIYCSEKASGKQVGGN